MRVRKPSPTESPLLFEIDPEPIAETLTALGGAPLSVQTFRSLARPAKLRGHVRIDGGSGATTKPRCGRTSRC